MTIPFHVRSTKPESEHICFLCSEIHPEGRIGYREWARRNDRLARTPSAVFYGLKSLLPTLSLFLVGLLLGAFAHPLSVLSGNTLLDPLGQEPQRFFLLESSVRTALR